MKTTVKTFWICLLLTLGCSFSSNAANYSKAFEGVTSVACEVTAYLSSYSSTSDNLGTRKSVLSDTEHFWSQDVELGNKSISETYFSNQQRLRRVLEDESFLKNILLMLSNHENLLVQGRTKLYYSDQDPYYVIVGCDYYIFTLRRILI